MVLYTDKALGTMQAEIARLRVKLAETKPTDEWPLDEIRGLAYYLDALASACKSEQRRRERIERERSE